MPLSHRSYTYAYHHLQPTDKISPGTLLYQQNHQNMDVRTHPHQIQSYRYQKDTTRKITFVVLFKGQRTYILLLYYTLLLLYFVVFLVLNGSVILYYICYLWENQYFLLKNHSFLPENHYGIKYSKLHFFVFKAIFKSGFLILFIFLIRYSSFSGIFSLFSGVFSPKTLRRRLKPPS